LSTKVLQDSVATLVNYGEHLMIYLLQICCWVWW